MSARPKLSPIFGTQTPPARPGVYRWRFALTGMEWRYARWDGKRWHSPNFTPRRAAADRSLIDKLAATIGCWRGLAEPS